jgi:hypothetical protein
MPRTLILVFSLIVSLARMGWTDGGAIQFQGDAGSFHVTVFTLPPILSAGSVDVTVLIQDRSKLNPLLDAQVLLDLSPQTATALKKETWSPPACAMDMPVSLTDIPAKLNHGENRLFYGALVQVPFSGIWKLKINVRRDGETENVSTLLKVNPPSPPPLAYWQLFALPPLGVLGFILNRTAKGRSSGVAGVQELQNRKSTDSAARTDF